MSIEKATFAAGCFWGVEAAFRQLDGVVTTTVGYMGGNTINPTYEDVCTDKTDHAEVCQIEYNNDKLSYAALLKTFWNCHNPTTRNRQGLDIGSRYRSVIFFHSPQQKAAARTALDKLNASDQYPDPVVTEIVAASEFYRAEDYHQQYLEKRGILTCRTPDKKE